MNMTGKLDRRRLRQQNIEFANTGGVSSGNRDKGFVPAFCNTGSGRCVRSRFADGSPAPIHVLDGLPRHWIEERDSQGNATSVIANIIAGFLLGGRFYTREEAVDASTLKLRHDA